MEIEQNWQNYRSKINDEVAIFSVNLGIFDQFALIQDECRKILQINLSFSTKQATIVEDENYQNILKEIFKISTLLSTVKKTCYVGYSISSKKTAIYFYCKNEKPLLEILKQFPEIESYSVQKDPNWDIYFDFLIPSPLEMKINATEEILAMLQQNNRSLENIFYIEHTFYFSDTENMRLFLEKIVEKRISFVKLQHSPMPVPIDEDENETAYIVQLDQEIALNTPEIFQSVEIFEILSNQFSATYVGWESQDISLYKNHLN
ncbi:uncharacterized protein (TIGR01619 family) [Bisgaardia hudsonensis]|uniref:Uncharacterized protein (TIGR01619 family) n=1 Tax=Bisgaardia hudsonensis TaxID=109472 RepID=A0A4R2N192_9PAST|nr:TIGR01619 family protein [Bisgaardia hudsonensis]QLB13129.1 TIGR01619 family protein [Bisgaardia hudsonensis]TCP13300.1 uncharacterized protein (TIGR01619 family) [Bisgaardia hudsonensis]